MDALSGLLDGPRARDAFLMRVVMRPPWSVRIEDEAPLSLVALVAGEAWVCFDGAEPVPLAPGDVAGSYQLGGEVSRPLVSALPPLAVLRRDDRDSPLVEVLAGEIGRDERSQSLVLDRLLDLLTVAVLRSWLGRPEAGA